MSRDDRFFESPDRVPLSDAAVLRDQRDANEKLVLATLLAQEAADSARAALHSAEHDAGVLRASTEELQSVAEFRERLIGIVGHDLRNPLNTVIMASGLLLSRGDLGEADTRLVKRIVESGQRMARTINQLMDFTRARLGGLSLSLARADAGDICRNIADEMRISSSADIVLAAHGDLAGSWDADRISEVISNLVGNAIDYAAPDSSITIDARGDQASVSVDITNQGKTIPPESLTTIFLAYRRTTDPAKRSNEHLGLGLYIASEIVRAHHGTLNVRSSDGSTTFTVWLPRVPPPPSSSPRAA